MPLVLALLLEALGKKPCPSAEDLAVSVGLSSEEEMRAEGWTTQLSYLRTLLRGEDPWGGLGPRGAELEPSERTCVPCGGGADGLDALD